MSYEILLDPDEAQPVLASMGEKSARIVRDNVADMGYPVSVRISTSRDDDTVFEKTYDVGPYEVIFEEDIVDQGEYDIN